MSRFSNCINVITYKLSNHCCYKLFLNCKSYFCKKIINECKIENREWKEVVTRWYEMGRQNIYVSYRLEDNVTTVLLFWNKPVMVIN